MTDLTPEKRAELRAAAEREQRFMGTWVEIDTADLLALLDAADERDELAANPRDEYHTMEELYEYRMLYNALAANAMPDRAVKSWRHSDGGMCFGGGWFVVYLHLPTGQVSNHYKAEHWDLFRVPEVGIAPEWDGHTPAVAADRLRRALADRHAANEERQRERQREDELEDAWQSRDWETVRRLQDEAEQREKAEPDPLDENDHRDRFDSDGGRIIRKGPRHWHTPIFRTAYCDDDCTEMSLRDWARLSGPLAFAPDAAPDAPRADLTASEAEGVPEGEGAPKQSSALLHLAILRDTVADLREMSTPSVSTRGWSRGWRAGVDLCTEILAEIADEYEKEAGS